MYERTDTEIEAIQELLSPHFGNEFEPEELTNREQAIVEQILEYVGSRFSRMKYILGLALDFAIVAQRISNVDESAKEFRDRLTIEQLFTRYQVVTERGEQQANTLTLKFGQSTQVGIRRIEESLVQFFHSLNRSKYPSAYVYNTGQWQKFQDLLILCFRLSESGKFVLCQQLIDFGLERLPKNIFVTRDSLRVRLFPEIVEHYPRSDPNENGGLVFQAIACGYFKADRPHLSFVVDKVRTGSSRQRRFGDIDGYYGLDLEISIEVKDCHISLKNLKQPLGSFQKQVTGNQILGIAFVLSTDSEASAALNDSGIIPFAQDELIRTVRVWDWQKQDAAVHEMLHYLAHIEQNPSAVSRLLAFIRDRDREHNSLAYYQS
jgi:hypothetical protein